MTYEHVFAIPAYKDSPYLERCIRSLKAQSVPTHIILCTSTPSPFLEDMAKKYGLPIMCVRGRDATGRTGILPIPRRTGGL